MKEEDKMLKCTGPRVVDTAGFVEQNGVGMTANDEETIIINGGGSRTTSFFWLLAGVFASNSSS